MASIQDNDVMVIMEDFNAQAGTDHQTWSSNLDLHGVSHINTNSLHIISIWIEFNLTITNTLSQ